MAVGVSIDGFTLPQITRIIQSINADETTGATSGNYSGSTSSIASTEASIAAVKVGATIGIYDPELAAILSGEI